MRKKGILVGCFLMVMVMPAAAVSAQETELTEKEATAATEAGQQGISEISEECLFGEFETMTLEGDKADQEIFAEADLSMVNIWATYCGPCIREMPDLGTLSREYEEKGVQIIGMIADVAEAGDEDAEAIVEYTQADYTHLIMSADLLQSYMSQVQVVPTTVFVDKEGRQVGEVYAGSRTEEEWAEIIEELLQELEDEE